MGPCFRRDDLAESLSINFKEPRRHRSNSEHDLAFPRRDAPEFMHEFLRPKGRGATRKGGAGATQGERGMPGARCTRSRACSVESTRVSHHGCTGSPGIPARNGFNGFLRNLPGDRALLSPSPAEISSADLTPASRRQDHTTSPSASAPFVKSASASTASHPNVRDDRDTPLVEG